MQTSRPWLIPTLACALALHAACDTQDAPITADVEEEAPLVAQQPERAKVPFFTGELGRIELGRIKGGAGAIMRGRDATDYAAPARSFLRGFALDRLNATGDEVLDALWVRQNKLGEVGIRFGQQINGLPVRGAELFVSVDGATGTVTRVNGHFAPDRDLATAPALDAEHAIERALAAEGIQPTARDAAADTKLTYVLDKHDRPVLAWQTTVEYTDENGDPQRDIIFADALTGEMTARHPQHKYARSLETRDCEEMNHCSVVVSTSSDAITTGDTPVDAAHNHAIATYNYYFNHHGRDSINDSGMTLISRAHYNRNYNNAFWDGRQMTYGDGDGVTFLPLSQDADVVAHELTHGVTERSSNLIYANESGALNEAWSDIFGAIVDRQEGASVTDSWLIGEDIYTPGTPGDALRVMNDPAAVGDSDYYPTRYTGTSDNGGVHWNSGIANLAFVLLVEGGTHPRGKTSVNVPALHPNFDTSLAMAGDIFYYANVSCMTPNTNFEGARRCTAAGANALYGQAAVDAVHAAWDAVGVPGGGDGGGGSDCDGSVVVAIDDHGTVAANTLYTYTIAVPEGACDLLVTTAADNGDTDLYIKLGSEATPTEYDFGSYSTTSNEEVRVASPSSGTWYVGVYGYQRTIGVTVHGEYQNP